MRLIVILSVILGSLTGVALAEQTTVKIRCETREGAPGLGFLSWDTEGGNRVDENLLLPDNGVSLYAHVGDDWNLLQDVTVSQDIAAGTIRQVYRLSPETQLIWQTTTAQSNALQEGDAALTMRFSLDGSFPAGMTGVRLLLPFNPRVTPTTAIPDRFDAAGGFNLPAIVSAPDFGQMVLAEKNGRTAGGLLLGSRAEKIVHLVIDLPLDDASRESTLTLTPLVLKSPDGLSNRELWQKARRGWFNPLQTTCRWGDPNNPYSAPPGLLANNVVSDPASCSLWFYADQAFWTPQPTSGISIMNTVRSTTDFWLDHKVKENGEVICYWHYAGFLDANAGPIIAAWDYAAATNDTQWLESKIERLEFVADYLVSRDMDGDGMVEAIQSGNYGTLMEPNRSCAWWDALNCGHKDGYTNAVIFRAWCCLADLERKLGRTEQAKKYARYAKKLKASYAENLRNPETGWLAWWKSEDGMLHDYASPTINGMAIEYGLVSSEEGRAILQKLWEKMDEVGFSRFDLGVPPMLIPVLRADYLLPNAIGCPQREDGTDTLGHYMNGGITAGHVFHFLAAHYIVGMDEKADFLLQEMLKRQAEGKFQNGVTDAAYQGIDWTDWQGNPTGYEGYLAESCRFLQAIVIREPELRTKYYAPIVNLEDDFYNE
ncbi:MAG: hypothetical protein FWH27_02310 [Planctomycetaceae bacterium]|nr:hypothetical protein [Planctomycetaceae bacterium]